MVTFKYNNKQYTTNNLEKKLSKLGISIDDIELLGKNEKVELEIIDRRYVIVRSTQDEIRRVCFIPKDHTPTIRELFKHHMWNGNTGIKDFTEEYLTTLYYERIDS